jgi:pyruvate/2-oxoglutarate dehydrogenase complex dihydrolipoamide dehydrogenase (E3) component
MSEHYEFVVLGGGSAGYAAARTAVDLGLKTAVVDGAETLGGLCILRGCMPSKSLIESANRNLTLRRAAEFGLRAENLSVRPDEIRARKRRLIGEFAEYRQEQLADGRFALLRGSAAFVDAHTLRVTLREEGAESREITADSILVATGSAISRLDLPGLEEVGSLTSDDVLDADTIPASIIVLGGGAIALEMAHYYDGVGAKVAVVQRSPHVLKDLDADVSESLVKAFRERGLEVYTGTELLHAGRAENGEKTITFFQEGGTITLAADEILQALGRHPNTDGLALEKAGVETQKGRVKADQHQATSVPHIFAAGDVCGPYEVVHTAIEQGECAATNAAVHLGKLPAGKKRTMDYRLRLLGIFTEPQVASVGMTEKDAAAEGLAVEVADYPCDDHGKSMVLGETEGFVKLIARQDTGELVGGAVVGPEAVELIHEIVVAMHFRATAADLAKIPHYHPTLSEIWTYPAEELAEKTGAASGE